ncbi:heterokaryon incompatibility protein-domain-containing protein [Lineolata rhizophorae]|uniref:Heterokaryon incompatibility protein-domain-containing protein n=1 Tax=Lineolata rhizophorae TaxID=578093 RepID=A0A6A6P298_9PEZI|nr:heterokaryon incompatibility protein-domain-containing protein [Lineolata rhizophorae]
MSYKYLPLRQNNQIRLVEIQPGRYDSETIYCTIIRRCRSDPSLKYEALSYTWGDASKLKRIIVKHSKDFYVTSNCYDALRQLRDPQEKRLIWIDAICINQKDDEERTQQVRVMGEIYKGASRVLVYLGEVDENSKRLFAYIARFEAEIDGVHTSWADLTDDDSILVETARAILRRPWFSRVWVIQEVYHGRGYTTVVCGPDSAHWGDFASCCMDLCKSGPGDFGHYSARLPTYVFTIGSSEDSALPLYELLCQTRFANATDPRDKFFGILSMATDQDDVASLANYDQSTTTIYTVIGLYLLRTTKLLLLQATRHQHSKFPGLASWIPDWSRNVDSDPFWNVRPDEVEAWLDEYEIDDPELRILECCKPNKAESDHFYHPVLSVTGFRLGRIKSLGARFDFESSSDACTDALKRVWESGGQEIDTPYIPPGFTSESFDSLGFYHAWSRGHGATDELNFEFVQEAMHDCRLFFSENNILGLAPSEAAPGDVICVIKGAADPCLLRRRLQGDWSLVSGECYYGDLFPVNALPQDLKMYLSSQKGIEFGDEEIFTLW